jgi:hypothetical protein
MPLYMYIVLQTSLTVTCVCPACPCIPLAFSAGVRISWTAVLWTWTGYFKSINAEQIYMKIERKIGEISRESHVDLWVWHTRGYRDIRKKCVILIVDSKGFWRWWNTELLGFWAFPSSGILGNRGHDVSETGSVSVFRWERKTPTQLGRLERANLSHWTIWTYCQYYGRSNKTKNRNSFGMQFYKFQWELLDSRAIR